MIRSRLISSSLLVLLIAGCSSDSNKPAATLNLASSTPAVLYPSSVGHYQADTLTGDYARYPVLNQFIDHMVTDHGFERSYLLGLFSQAKRKQWTLDYLTKSDQTLKGKPGKGSWSKYRSQFLDDRHINTGVIFWQQHQQSLEKASLQYGVPAEYVLGIMAVETTFGGFVGNHRVLDALTTLSFDYARRGEYFRSELEKFLLMTRNESLDPAKPVGSFAGAMGLGQFMPSSFLNWAVDFNADGRRDLWNPDDAIGSIARYFAEHGWQSGQPVVSATRGQLSATSQLEPGLEHPHDLSSLRQAGIELAGDCHCDYPLRLLLLRHDKQDQYLIGHPNFYVITRYNQSTHYAMAVHELAQAIKSRYTASQGRV